MLAQAPESGGTAGTAPGAPANQVAPSETEPNTPPGGAQSDVKDATKTTDKDATKTTDKDATKTTDKDATKTTDKDATKTADQGGELSKTQGAVKGSQTQTPEGADSGGAAEQLVHRVRSVKATNDIVRGVLAGNAVLVELEKKLADDRARVVLVPSAQAKPGVAFAHAKQEPIPMDVQGYVSGEKSDSIVATVPKDADEGLYDVEVYLPSGAAVALERPQRLKVKSVNWILFWSALPIAAIILLIWGLLRISPLEGGQRGRNLLALLLVEPENKTYSLSRAQFTAWSIAIIGAYMFIFLARGLVENIWAFPPLEGFGMTFLISLGTLVTAQATSATKGAKGSGTVHPSPADLVLHGGVLALERVQQLVWTVIGIAMFLVIVFKSYASASELPVIPEELWVLMGVSSAGYLAGKAARKAGPIIDRVDLVELVGGNKYLAINGKSLAKKGRVLVDGRALEQEVVVQAEDTERPEYATELRVAWTGTPEEWYRGTNTLKLVNPDGQHADWRPSPVIDSAKLTPNEGDKATLVVESRYLGTAPTWELVGATAGNATATFEAQRQRWLWSIELTNVAQKGQVTAVTADKRRATASWSPAVGT